MHLRNLLLLALLVVALGGLAWWQLGREANTRVVSDARTLLPGLAPEAIVGLRVDQLERDVQLRAELRDSGVWHMIDPVDYPLEGALIPMLMDVLLATPSQDWPGEPAGHGLTPPRAVLEITARGPAGERTHRIELGDVDVDGQHVFARVDGELVRTLRNLESLLDRNLPDWRDHRLVAMAPTAVVELQRSGSFRMPGLEEAVDQTLHVVRDPRWRAVQPFEAALAPETLGPLISSLCYLRVAGFEEDAPGPLEFYGLEPPAVRITMTTVQGESVALRFAFQAGRERVLCLREGQATIFSVAPEQLMHVFSPVETLVDTELLRVQRERLEAFEVARPDGSFRFEREGFGWRVSTPGANGVQGARADGGAVENLLALIERSRVAEVLPGRSWPAGPTSLDVQFRVGDELRGWRLGIAIDGRRGTRGRAFMRSGETLLGLVEDDLSLLETFDLDSVQSRELHRVRELDLVQAQVNAPWAGTRRLWSRDARGRWTPEDSSAEARDFAALVDSLLTVRAERHLTAADEVRGLRPIQVGLVDAGGAARAAFTLSLLEGEAGDPAAAEVLYEGDGRRAVVDGRAYFGLAALLGI